MNPLILACTIAVAQEVPKPVAEMIHTLSAIEGATGPCRSIIDVGILPENVGIDGPWPPATLERAECQEWLWSGPKVRVRRFAPESEVLAIDSVENLRDLRIWSGSEWIVRNAHKRSCVLSTAPQLLPDDDCLSIFNGLCCASFAGRQGLAESRHEEHARP